MTRQPRILGIVLGLAMLGTLAVLVYQDLSPRQSKVMIGTRDEVYYSGSATRKEALALGQALVASGFFTNKGLTVLLTNGRKGPEVSFVVNEGAWNHPDTAANFEVIGRHIAPWIGGFPVRVKLIDTEARTRKVLNVGRRGIGTRDEVYYFGAATDADAQALGSKLREIGYFADLGATVAIAKNDGRAIWFVTNQGFWDKPEAIAEFERVARDVAPVVGGLPIDVRLLDAGMETRQKLTVE